MVSLRMFASMAMRALLATWLCTAACPEEHLVYCVRVSCGVHEVPRCGAGAVLNGVVMVHVLCLSLSAHDSGATTKS